MGQWEGAEWRKVGGLDFDTPVEKADVARNNFRVPAQVRPLPP